MQSAPVVRKRSIASTSTGFLLGFGLELGVLVWGRRQARADFPSLHWPAPHSLSQAKESAV